MQAQLEQEICAFQGWNLGKVLPKRGSEGKKEILFAFEMPVCMLGLSEKETFDCLKNMGPSESY